MQITVVIPLYNKAATIEATLQTVLDQQQAADEVLIVDDGSRDNSLEIIAQSAVAAQLPIRILRQENQGVSAARNTGWRAARHDWVCFLDADDLWEPDFLATLSELKKKCPEARLLASTYSFLSPKGQKRPAILRRLQLPQGALGYLDNYFEVAAHSNPPVWTSATALHREALEAVGGFPVGIKSGEDLLTWARVALRYRVAYAYRVLAYYRDNADMSVVSARRSIDDPVGAALLAELAHCPEALRTSYTLYLGRWLKSMGVVIFQQQDMPAARAKFREALPYTAEKFKIYIFYLLTYMPKRIRMSLYNVLKK
ncbi:MAG: glycosyltransferase family 2 protein [Nitritalea sp.]